MTRLLLDTQLNFGRSEIQRWEPVHVVVEDDRDSPKGLTDLMSTVPFLMVSRRFADLLRSFDCECEYLPLVVHYHGKTTEGEYFALNALRIFGKVIDRRQSKIGLYHEEFGLARDIEKLVLSEKELDDAPLSFLEEIGHFAVNEKLARAIEDADLVGIKLLKPEEFSS